MRTCAPSAPARFSLPCSSARRRFSTSVADCVKFTYSGLICCTSASGVASPWPTSAPSVTSARPMRPEIGEVTERVVQVDLRGLHGGAGGGDVGLGLLLRGDRVGVVLLADGVGLHQRLVALGQRRWPGLVGLRARQRGLRAGVGGLQLRRVDAEQHLAGRTSLPSGTAAAARCRPRGPAPGPRARPRAGPGSSVTRPTSPVATVADATPTSGGGDLPQAASSVRVVLRPRHPERGRVHHPGHPGRCALRRQPAGHRRPPHPLLRRHAAARPGRAPHRHAVPHRPQAAPLQRGGRTRAGRPGRRGPSSS
jgi:hypothetical protein